jgi:hypothetical protein
MTTSYTTLLGLAQPQTGDLSGTWGAVVNASVTQLVEDSVAGVATQSVASGNWTLSTTGAGATNEARKAILIPTGSPGVSRDIIAPGSSKAYIVINQSNAAVVLKSAATAGVTIATGASAVVAWNGSGFVNVTPSLSAYLSLAGGTMTGAITFAAGQFGTNVNTFLSTPSSANLAAALTDETGSGAAVFATSPTLVTPVLGTPSSGTLSSCTVDGTNGVGYINIPQNSQSAAYTLVAADAGKHIFHPSTDANARTFTIPANGSVAYPIGTAISFVNMTSQVVSIAITTDTMYLAGTGTTGTRSLAQYGTATALKMTSTTWIISGAGLT